MKITSTRNPVIKNMVSLLHKSRERSHQALFVTEGFRELQQALKNGFQAVSLFYDPTTTSIDEVERVQSMAVLPPKSVVELSREVMEKIAYRSSVANVVGLFQAKSKLLNEVVLSQNPLVLVCESVEKPGNLGAMLRTADAAGVDAVIVCEPEVDLYNPNTIRASLGAVFSVQVIVANAKETAQWLKANHIRMLATYLESSRSLFDTDLTSPLAFLLGAESTGISDFWLKQADERVIIPMMGSVDSLNVSASTAIVLFEAVRQRLKQ
jgi:TrmH family RNA methyltransferase